MIDRGKGRLDAVDADGRRLHADRVRDEGLRCHGVAGEDGEVVDGRVVPVGIESVGVLEVGVVHAEFGCLVVHHLDEGVLGASDSNGYLVGGVVGGVDEHDVEQVLKARRAAGLVACHHGVLRKLWLREGADLVEWCATLERHERRHDLGDRRHVDLFVWVLLIEHRARGVHDDGGLGLAEAGLGVGG